MVAPRATVANLRPLREALVGPSHGFVSRFRLPKRRRKGSLSVCMTVCTAIELLVQFIDNRDILVNFSFSDARRCDPLAVVVGCALQLVGDIILIVRSSRTPMHQYSVCGLFIGRVKIPCQKRLFLSTACLCGFGKRLRCYLAAAIPFLS